MLEPGQRWGGNASLVVGVTYGELTPKTSLVFVLQKFRDDTSLEEDKMIVLPPSKQKSDHYSLRNRENDLAGGSARTLVSGHPHN